MRKEFIVDEHQIFEAKLMGAVQSYLLLQQLRKKSLSDLQNWQMIAPDVL